MLVVTLGAGAALPLGRAAPAASSFPRVTLIGDSVADSLQFVPQATQILGRGIDLQLQLAPCRRVGQLSCPYKGVSPPNVIDLVGSLGSSLGDTVIVAVGYNDYEGLYAQNIEDALAALKKAGVKRVIWPTMRAAYHSYLTMNDDLRAAAATHPELTVVDWNAYSRSHPDWFQSDGLHLIGAGVVAFGTFLHNSLVDLGIPLVLDVATARLPDAIVSKPYAVLLAAQNGKPPYRWTVTPALPRGLHLLVSGRLSGIPKGPVKVETLSLGVTDSAGSSTRRRLTLRIRAS
jgi:hypothetical protein